MGHELKGVTSVIAASAADNARPLRGGALLFPLISWPNVIRSVVSGARAETRRLSQRRVAVGMRCR